MFGNVLYRTSPSWLQELFIFTWSWSRWALRARGTSFQALRDATRRTQWYSAEQMREFQLAQLTGVLASAHDHVPYYRARFERSGFHTRAFRDLAQMSDLPFVDKETVRSEGGKLVSEAVSWPLMRCHTSGSTGIPLTLYQDLRAVRRENAFISRQLEWAGFEEGGRRAWIRGDMIVPGSQRSGPYWRLDRNDNMLMLSSYHLSAETAESYLDALHTFDPLVIQAYPSSVAFLAFHLEETGRKYRGRALRSVLTSSETLSAEQRGAIERAFGCRVFDWYGNGERVAAIGTCEEGSYHAMTDYSYVEFVPADDGTHEIVGTGFNNLVMPLIRYRTGDHVRLAPESARCACGRSLPLVEEIHGRKDDVVKLPDGRHIGRLHHIFNGVTGILGGQIIQDALDRIEIRVVPSAQFGRGTERSLLANARARLGEAIGIELTLTDAIIRTRNGKLRNVICNV